MDMGDSLGWGQQFVQSPVGRTLRCLSMFDYAGTERGERDSDRDERGSERERERDTAPCFFFVEVERRATTYCLSFHQRVCILQQQVPIVVGPKVQTCFVQVGVKSVR